MIETENDFERLRKVLLRQGEPKERVPFYEHFVDIEIIETITGTKLCGLDLGKKDEKEKYWKTVIDFYYRMGYDYVPIEIVPNFPRDNRIVVSDTAELARVNGRSWQDENRGVISNWEEFEKYPWPEHENIIDYSQFEFVAKNMPDSMKIIGGIGGGVYEHWSWIIGLVPLSFMLYEQPELAKAVVDKVGETIYIGDKTVLDIVGDKMGALRMGDDMGFKTATMLPPEVLRKYVFPWQKKVADLAHSHGIPFILHSCGQLEQIMDDLINYVGIDAKHSFEDAILSISEAKKKYGDKIALLGGVDVDKLCRLTEDELRKYVRKILEDCVPCCGYALGSGNTITNYVPIKNYLIMLDEGKKFKL